jgi:5-methylcytosine-specific restriction endonuclease McrA
LPQRLCSHPNGTHLIEVGTTCAEAARARRATRAARPIEKLYSSTAYRALRRQVFDRDGHRCRYCGKPATERDPLTLAHLDETQKLLAHGLDALDPDRCVTGHRSCAAANAPSLRGGASA